MDHALFEHRWAQLDLDVKRKLKDFSRYPTERNECYLVGYLGALNDYTLLSQEQYTYWLSATGLVRKEPGVLTALRQCAQEIP